MTEVSETRQGIDILNGSAEPAIFPAELDNFMQNFGREATLGKVAVDAGYWEQRIEYMREKLRGAEVARKAVAIIASDAATFIEREPEKFAELPPEQRDVLEELAARITDTDTN